MPEPAGSSGRVKSAAARADVDRMAVVAAFLFFALITLCAALLGVGYYYVRVLRPQLGPRPESSPAAAPASEGPAPDALATFVEQLQELARLRDQGLLTSKEFTSKKTELLERI